MADGSVKILTALDNTGLEKGVKEMNSKVAAGAKSAASAMATGLKGVGTAIGAATAALGGIGAAVIKTGSEFEAKMSRVKAISNATSSEFQQLNAQAKKLGADTAFSASEAADGMENLAAAGFSVNEITKAMPGLLDMAAASGESIANSSEIASSALRAFGLDASKTGHIADVLAANANMTNAAVMDTGYAFKYAAPIAHSLGMSMEETTAAIGIMSNAGIKGEQAGTTLRGALTRLVNPTKQVKKGMAELGVSFFDSNGKMKSLDTIVGDLSTSTAKLTQQQKNQTLAQIFGTESLSGMLALVDAGPAQLDKLTKAYEHSDGAAKAAAKTMQDNLKGAIEQAGGSLETLGIDLYESVDNPAKKAVQAVTDYVNQLSKAFEGKGWDGFTKEIGTVAADAVKQIAAAAPAAVKEGSNLIKSLADGISDNSDDIAKSAVEIGKSLISGIEETVPALGKAAGGLIKGVLSEIAGPEAGQAVQDTMDSIGQAFQSLKGPAQDAIKSTIQIIGNLASAVSEVSQTVLPVLSSALGFAAQNIQTVGPIVLGIVGAFKEFTAVKAAAQSVVKFTEALSSAAKVGSLADKAITGVWGAASALTGPVGLAIAAIVGITLAIGAAVIASGDFKSSEEKLADSSKALGKSYSDVVKGIDDFKDGVQSADSILKDMNTDLIVSSSDSKKVSDGMQSVQNEINGIAKKASDERRALTDGEIKKLNDLFEKMHELAQQQTAQNKAYQDAVRSRAIDTSDDTSMSADQYQQESNKIIKAASERKQATINAAESEYENEYALIQKRTDLSSSAKEKLINNAKSTRQATVDSANKEASQTVSILASGYTKHAADLQTYVTKTQQTNSAVDAENQRHQTAIKSYQDQCDKILRSGTATQDEVNKAKFNLQAQLLNESSTHNQNLKNLSDQENKILDSSTKKQLSTLLGYVVQSGAAYNKLDSSTQEAIKSMMEQFKSLGPDGQKEINDMLDKMGLELESNGDIVYKAGDKAGQVVLKMDEVMKSGTLHAPANLDDSDLLRKAGESAQEALARIKGILSDSTIDVHAKIAIESYGAGSRPISGPLQAGVNANGGIYSSPMLTTLCEEHKPEAIIPLNPARRGRALDLWQQTGKALGVMQNANGGIYGTLPSNPKVAVSASMMSSILGWAKINTGKDDKLSEKIVEQAQKTLDNLKQYDELSTAEEVRFWEKVKKIRGLAGSQLNEVDHKIYEAKKANSEAIVSDAEKYLSHYQNIGQMTDDWEISYWQRTLNREGLFADQKNEIEEKIYSLQQQRTQDIISDAEKRFSHSEAIGQQDAEAELRYWQNLIKAEKLGGDEYNTVLEKIYSAQQKIKDADKQRSKDNYDYFNGYIQDDKDFDRIDTKGELARWKSIYDDYKNGLIFLQADEVKQIEKNIHSLQKEVDGTAQQAQDTAKQNWQSRVDSLKSWSGMFDEPSYNYEISKEELMWNMQEQVRMMQNWQSDLANLQARGISSAMAKELENLGPASADKIRALSEMTDEELQKYSSLYAAKGNLATGQANAETGITSTVTDSAAVAVTQSVSSLSDAVQQQLPNLTSQFQQGGADAGNAYGTAFVERVKAAMSDFSSIVQSSVSGAQVQLNSTMQAANAASSAIDRLNAKVSGMKVEQVQQVTQLSMSGRQVAKAIAPYAGTYLKLNGG
ncbi:phage tail tape measure protein [Caproicibacterium amylolyticum]|uniref:Phage tail tape measure protein n=1 Tax=Caproicibacterium amylolyticum TaxID=2766537 RepID=A0A7G9WJE8_9FIRM|nr:phage tail tape measure protein [Caproicibacterium amylolyticum]QNO18810.1 phage tail tape measure protein [Caproicibacterium amylolyticum]